MKLGISVAVPRRLLGCDRGASAIEYGLLAALIAVALVAVLLGAGTSVGSSYDAAASAIHRNATATYNQ